MLIFVKHFFVDTQKKFHSIHFYSTLLLITILLLSKIPGPEKLQNRPQPAKTFAKQNF